MLAERRLEAEQKKFGVGTSTSFLVFQAQRDLATARVNELQALLDYNKSLVDFEAVQEAAISGGGISISGGGSFVATTAGTQTATAATQGSARRSVGTRRTRRRRSGHRYRFSGAPATSPELRGAPPWLQAVLPLRATCAAVTAGRRL